MEFKKFTSIENSYRQKEVQLIQVNFPKEMFVVQEKVHGANLSFWTDGKEVKCAKQSGFIQENEDFYNYEIVLDKYKQNILNLFNSIKGAEEVAIYGEIYGGNYPHEGVKQLPVKTIQKGVYYSPNVEFIAFDIKVNGRFEGFDSFVDYCMIYEIPFLGALKRGTLEDCLSYPNEYNSTIPAMHGLPELKVNTCEGNVIRPINVIYFGNGSRVILKNKNDKFTEKETVKKEYVPKEPTPDHVVEIQKVATEYITENRLKNVISKIGTVSDKEFGKLLGLFCKDTIEDFMKDESKFESLDKKERKMVTSLINKEAGNLIRKNFLKIVDGNF